MATSRIEWTDATWNPVAGCTILSAGCTNCYAMRMAARLEAMGIEKYKGLTRKSGKRMVWTGKVRLDERSLDIPKSWSKPKRVFVNSMSDLFQEKVPFSFIEKIWTVMRGTPQHTYQILTKRPDLMAKAVPDLPVLQNVWLGTSVEDSKVVSRLNDLRQCALPYVKFSSFEPLIGSVGKVDLSGIHWAIVGGESGPRARPMQEEWVDEIRIACRKHKTAFFFKQWGGKNKKLAGRTYRGRLWDDLPEVRI
jgi:protein gp37